MRPAHDLGKSEIYQCRAEGGDGTSLIFLQSWLATGYHPSFFAAITRTVQGWHLYLAFAKPQCRASPHQRGLCIFFEYGCGRQTLLKASACSLPRRFAFCSRLFSASHFESRPGDQIHQVLDHPSPTQGFAFTGGDSRHIG